eukprot:XP_015575552.1 uncharacterized protein LOC107261368 [Ricinus communis]
MAEELKALTSSHMWDMVDLPSNKSMVAIATVKRQTLFQMDVKIAFLNGDLTKEVYMQPPPGYDHPPNKVCILRKALYGLKQSPRAWFVKFSSTICRHGFQSSPHDHALFLRTTKNGTILLLLYVDDMIVTSDETQGIQDLKNFLSRQFEMKDLSCLSYFLGLKVTFDSTGYYLSQAKYATDLISLTELTDDKIANTPIETNAHFSASDGSTLLDCTLYRQLVASLIYLTVTRPDISYAVHIVNQFIAAPHTTYYAVVLCILCYIKGTLFHGLHYSSLSSLQLQGYSYADWAGDPTDRRSTTGYCFFLGDSIISWRCKKQTVVSRSSTEAKYRAFANTTSELLWLRWLLQSMGISSPSATLLHCDNRNAMQIAHNNIFHERTKHIEIDCHFAADIFTKAHSAPRFRDLISKLKLFDSHPS